MLKIIKKEALNTTFEWSDGTWPESLVFKRLSRSDFLTNAQYIPNTTVGSKTWKDIIVTINWKYGIINISNTGADQAGTGVLTAEKEWTDTVSAQISLMYLSDYYLAYDNTSNWYTKRGTDNWLFIGNNDTGIKEEWTMSKYMDRSVDDYGWKIYDNGGVGSTPLYKNLPARPVFYLSEKTKITSGTGTESDPYIITDVG